MMKTSKLILSLALLLLLHLSCSRDERRSDDPAVSKPNQARVTITLEVDNDSPVHSRTPGMPERENAAADTIQGVAASYSVGDFGVDSAPAVATDSLSTRSTPAAAVNESVVNDLWAIQFDENNKLVGRPVYQDGLQGKTEVTLMLTQTPEGKSHTVYFVTNTARKNLFDENNVPTLERYRALLHSYANESEVVTGGVLLMTGKYVGTLIDGEKLNQPIALTRGVAKITFTYGTANFDDGTIRILSVQLKNVAHRTAYLAPTAVPYPAIGSHADYAPEAAPGEAAGKYFWYLPENVRGTNPAISWEGNKSKKNAPTGQGDYATLIEVRAEVTTRAGATSNISYQFFIGEDITDYSVKRNRHYQLAIDFRGIDESDQRVVAGSSTPWLAPTVGISGIAGTTATVRATLISDGGSAITSRGFYLSEDKNEIGTAHAYRGIGLYELPGMPSYFTRAAFTPEVMEQVLTGLKRNTTYYVRPFATNIYGTTVGEQATFSTNNFATILANITAVDGKYVQASIGVSEPPAPAAMGVMWSTTDFTNPTLGTQSAGTQVGDRFNARLGGGYPATWYLYPYGQMSGGERWYGTKYSADRMPTSPAPEAPDIETDATLNMVTLQVGTQSPGAQSTLSSRGIVYSTTASFDPLAPGATSVPGSTTGMPNLFRVTLENLLPNLYYARSYAVNSAGHTYYSPQSFIYLKPKVENRTTTWGEGNTISNEPSVYTLEFGTNTDWVIETVNATVSESSGVNTKWATKSVTVNVGKNEGAPRQVVVHVSPIIYGGSSSSFKLWMMQEKVSDIPSDVFERPFEGYWDDPLYVDNLQLLDLMDWHDATARCAAWGGRLPNQDELTLLLGQFRDGYYLYDEYWKYMWYWSSSESPYSDYKMVTLRYNGGLLNSEDKEKTEECLVRCVRDYLTK